MCQIHTTNLCNQTCYPSLLRKATVQGVCDLVTLTRDFKPAFYILLKIDSLRFSDSKSETQSDVMRWNKLSMSTLLFLLCLPRTMMIASYLSHCYSPLWDCLPNFHKGEGSYRYYLSIYYIIPVSVTRAHRKLITDGHKHYGCTRRQSGGHGDY